MRNYIREQVQPGTAMESLCEQYGNEDLSKMVRHCCQGKPPTRKEELLALLLQLLQAENLPAAVGQLTELQKQAVSETA